MNICNGGSRIISHPADSPVSSASATPRVRAMLKPIATRRLETSSALPSSPVASRWAPVARIRSGEAKLCGLRTPVALAACHSSSKASGDAARPQSVQRQRRAASGVAIRDAGRAAPVRVATAGEATVGAAAVGAAVVGAAVVGAAFIRGVHRRAGLRTGRGRTTWTR